MPALGRAQVMLESNAAPIAAFDRSASFEDVGEEAPTDVFGEEEATGRASLGADMADMDDEYDAFAPAQRPLAPPPAAPRAAAPRPAAPAPRQPASPSRLSAVTRAGVVKAPEREAAKQAEAQDRPAFKVSATPPLEDKALLQPMKEARAAIQAPAKKRAVWAMLAILGLLAVLALLLWWLVA